MFVMLVRPSDDIIESKIVTGPNLKLQRGGLSPLSPMLATPLNYFSTLPSLPSVVSLFICVSLSKGRGGLCSGWPNGMNKITCESVNTELNQHFIFAIMYSLYTISNVSVYCQNIYNLTGKPYFSMCI